MLLAGTTSYAYDHNGNLTARTLAGATTSYQYDTLGRLRTVLSPGGIIAEYTYDALNQRVQRVTPSGTTNFLVDAAHGSGLSQVVMESDAAGVLTAAYTHAGATPLSQTVGGQTSWRLTDGVGSTRLLADAAGSLTDSYAYDAFGNLIGRTGTTPTAYQFNGQEFDTASGLYHLRAREYDPLAGRFTAVDPFTGVPTAPQTLHPYLYAQNDPVNASDPSGQVTLMEVMVVASTILTVATTAYDLWQGDYKGAAINVALGFGPLAIFKAVKHVRSLRSVAAAAVAAPTENLPAGAITEVAGLAPTAVTETALSTQQVAAAIGDDAIVAASAMLPEMELSMVAYRAVRATRGAREVSDFIIGQTDDLRAMWEAMRRLYAAGRTTADDMAQALSKFAGQPGWQVKLCALASANYIFTGNTSDISRFGALVEVGVNLALRGSGYRCRPGANEPW